jgi:hypothetical protein
MTGSSSRLDTKTAPSFTGCAVTSEARQYAVRELARRAGVTSEFLRSWRIEASNDEIAVYPEPNVAKKVVFPSRVRSFVNDGLVTRRASWMSEPPNGLKSRIPDFVIPFAPGDANVAPSPLFVAETDTVVRCRADLLASILYSLCRVEERFAVLRDAHDRFPGTGSIAMREGFLQRPIVDEYGFGFAQALGHLLPGWTSQPRPFQVNITHDIDLVGIPFSLHASAGHVVRRRRPLSAVRDLASLLGIMEPAYLQAVRDVVQLANAHGLRSTANWKASRRTAQDTGYDPGHPRVREVIDELRTQGVELGVHPGYFTYQAAEELSAEVARLKHWLRESQLGGRQHFLRWCPDTWADWENCDLAYDSSVGFADQPGFRAGTAIPYHPWLIQQNREARLLEVPLILMDGTIVDYLKVSPDKGYEIASTLIDACKLVGGVFTLLWHNGSLLEPGYGDLYSRILTLLDHSQSYDWRLDRNGESTATPAWITTE